MINWYTSELELSLYDKQSRRQAQINLDKYKGNKYVLNLCIQPERMHEKTEVIMLPYNNLAQAKAVGKAWVEQGIKTEGVKVNE